MRSSVVSGAVRGLALLWGQGLAAPIQNGLCRSLISQNFLPKGDTNRRFRRTLRNKRFFGASDTTANQRARSSCLRPPHRGQWNDEVYDVLADGLVVGRIFLSNASPVGTPWMWTLRLRPSRGPHADARLRADARGRDGGVRIKLAAGVSDYDCPKETVFPRRISRMSKTGQFGTFLPEHRATV